MLKTVNADLAELKRLGFKESQDGSHYYKRTQNGIHIVIYDKKTGKFCKAYRQTKEQKQNENLI